MAIDFITIPPTACDAERAFSTGRRTINYMQHSTSAEVLNAKMCLARHARPIIASKLRAPSKRVVAKKSSSAVHKANKRQRHNVTGESSRSTSLSQNSPIEELELSDTDEKSS
ncbi:BZ3500_MvSof-1268-A1-R1_Chr12-2g03729 [Microbotryum saponariae]|uniref:BZ3500_MvSof-1268-A1-R1_Chr12-2g03729 protein n=1 Tax=Microbotryum saponariae TaxID=289078 RepID=A0A2X0NJ04_9BASI|nr:BZ3500_MvSof-1268-A1-R1_Chr12-2g03729 [Microbotryum saponariae]SDA05317.1 BZ3501_MvSof-1269-A2-R1_Chr12-1g03301 [Microbotryum saponariae]